MLCKHAISTHMENMKLGLLVEKCFFHLLGRIGESHKNTFLNLMQTIGYGGGKMEIVFQELRSFYPRQSKG